MATTVEKWQEPYQVGIHQLLMSEANLLLYVHN